MIKLFKLVVHCCALALLVQSGEAVANVEISLSSPDPYRSLSYRAWQGVCTDGSYLYVVTDFNENFELKDIISKYDMQGNLLLERIGGTGNGELNIQSGPNGDFMSFGSCTIADGVIYIPIYNRGHGSPYTSKVVTLNKDDLTLIDVLEIKDNSNNQMFGLMEGIWKHKDNNYYTSFNDKSVIAKLQFEHINNVKVLKLIKEYSISSPTPPMTSPSNHEIKYYYQSIFSEGDIFYLNLHGPNSYPPDQYSNTYSPGLDAFVYDSTSDSFKFLNSFTPPSFGSGQQCYPYNGQYFWNDRPANKIIITQSKGPLRLTASDIGLGSTAIVTFNSLALSAGATIGGDLNLGTNRIIGDGSQLTNLNITSSLGYTPASAGQGSPSSPQFEGVTVGTTTIGQESLKIGTYDATAPVEIDGSIHSSGAAGTATVLLRDNANHSRLELRGINEITGQVGPIFQGKGAYASGNSWNAVSATPKEMYLVGLGGSGHDGNNWVTGNRGLMSIKAAGNWTTGSQPTYITLETTPVGSTSRHLVAKIGSDGNVRLSGGTVNSITNAGCTGQATPFECCTGPNSGTCGTPPTFTCGTGASLQIGSSDHIGVITVGADTKSCTLTFASPKSNAPTCRPVSRSGLNLSYQISTAGLILEHDNLAGSKIDYVCNGLNE